MEYSRLAIFLGNLFCRFFDIQMSRLQTLLLKFLATTSGILCILLILFRAINQSISNGKLLNTWIGSFLFNYSNTSFYQFFIDLTIPLLLLFSFVFAPILSLIFKVMEPCEDYGNHTFSGVYNEDKTLKRLSDNLFIDHYKINYGNNEGSYDRDDDKHYLEAFRYDKNIYIKVFVYKQEHFHEIQASLRRQINECQDAGIRQFSSTRRSKGYILPIFIFGKADKETKQFVVNQYHKHGKARILPAIYSGEEDYWNHKRTKSPLILSIIKKLERSTEGMMSKEEFNRRYEEYNFFLKGCGYSYYKYGNESMETKKYRPAIKYLLKAIKVSKNDRDTSQAYFLIGNCHVYLNETEAAIVAYQRSLSYHSKNNGAMLGLAYQYANLQNYERSVHYFESYLAICPDDITALYEYGRLSSKLRELS